MKSMVDRLATLFSALILCILMLTSNVLQAEEPIKIGFMFDLTGFLAPVGKDNQQGALIALEQGAYKLMGRPIKAIIEDSGSDVNTAMDKVRKLAEVDKVRLIIGPIFGGAQQAMGGYADKVPIPILTIAPSQNIEVIKNKWSFLVHGTCESGGYPMGIYAAEVLGYKTAAILASDFVAGHEYMDGFTKGFESKGGKVIQYQYYPPGTKNFVPFFTAAKKADTLVTWFPGGDAFSSFKQYKELNIKMPIIQPADGGITANPSVNKGLGEGAIGVHTGVTYSHVANTPGNKEFVKLYTEKWGGGPGANAGGSYISTQVALEAIKKAGKDESPQALRNAILSLQMDTIHGTIKFNKDRLASYTCPVVVIEKEFKPKIVAEYNVSAEVNGKEIVTKVSK